MKSMLEFPQARPNKESKAREGVQQWLKHAHSVEGCHEPEYMKSHMKHHMSVMWQDLYHAGTQGIGNGQWVQCCGR